MNQMRKLNFCTLFDSYYLSRGIALYRSLELYCSNFHLYIFAFDDNSLNELLKLNLNSATIIPLVEFETEDLLRVKSSRTVAEYCWTCTPSIIWHAIVKFGLEDCTYLDADIYFFSSPIPIFDEIGRNSIGITKHNFSRDWKESEVYGHYCVQFVYFKNDQFGMEALNWWRIRCIEWCFAKLDMGRYGDQKYLDYFEERFGHICIVDNIGSGIAPWNINNFYRIEQSFGQAVYLEDYSGSSGQLIFYHFQGLKFAEKKDNIICEASIAFIPKPTLEIVYIPYVKTLQKIKYSLNNHEPLEKSIIFKRRIFIIISLFVKQKLKQFRIIRSVFYTFQRKRYNRPKNIG